MATVPFSKVIGKCYIAYGDGLEMPVEEWSELGPHRFYFNQGYNAVQRTVEDVDNHAKKTGQPSKAKGKLFSPFFFTLRMRNSKYMEPFSCVTYVDIDAEISLVVPFFI